MKNQTGGQNARLANGIKPFFPHKRQQFQRWPARFLGSASPFADQFGFQIQAHLFENALSAFAEISKKARCGKASGIGGLQLDPARATTVAIDKPQSATYNEGYILNENFQDWAPVVQAILKDWGAWGAFTVLFLIFGMKHVEPIIKAIGTIINERHKTNLSHKRAMLKINNQMNAGQESKRKGEK